VENSSHHCSFASGSGRQPDDALAEVDVLPSKVGRLAAPKAGKEYEEQIVPRDMVRQAA
jgi:hypothetical protein